jgi:REP element-mobilizing transposase RayT
MSHLPKRKPNRLKNYNYNQNGAYFVTVCVKNRHEILGEITAVGNAALGVPSVKLSEYGKTVKIYIENIPNVYPEVSVPLYVIMPNHIYLILVVKSENIGEHGLPRAVDPTKALIPNVINTLKGLSSKQSGFSLWQKSFHYHIIRDDDEYCQIEKYIENNPAMWANDLYYNHS